jgi:tetratricopeptide (TPR) repeat protein
LAGVPSFDSFAIVGGSMPGVSQTGVAESGAPAEFEWNSVAEESISDASASFADLNETFEESEVKVLPDALTADPSLFETGAQHSETEQLEAPDDADAARTQSMMFQELESVDFYITQGYTDIAIDTLDLLERQFGSQPQIDIRREKLKEGAAPNHEVSIDSGPELTASDSEFAIETGPATDITLAEMEESPARGNEAGALPSGSGIDSGLAEIFEEFRVEAEGESPASHEDFETHYNMATAYKEMDLLDEAIREFQLAAGLTLPADGTARYFQCCNMLGHCFIQKGMPRAAVIWFKKGLEAPGRTAEEYKALQYELGSGYEEMGDLARAVSVFTEVYGVDVGYRDVAEKLQNLQARQETHKKKKKGK